MSDYFKSLDSTDRRRYSQKLQLIGLKEDEDPYLLQNTEKFVDNMSRWPPVEFGHIFCYYIERPGLYTKQELLQWKSLEGYNYFKSGYVRNIKIWEIDSTTCILLAKVNPSQCSADRYHTAWVAVKSTGEIVICHCTCMAG